MPRLLGLTALMAVVFSTTYALMNADVLDPSAGVRAVTAQILVLVVSIFGASLSTWVVVTAVLNAEMQIWMTIRVSRHGSPLEYLFWLAIHTAVGMAFLGLVIRSAAKLANAGV